MAATFRYYLRVRYAECDAQKIVFNSRYGDYVDIATTEFFRAHALGADLTDGTFEYQLVRQLTEWKKSARYDDVLVLSVEVDHIGTTSFRTVTEFRRADEEDLLARVETVYVRVDGRTWEKRPLPADFSDRLSQGPVPAVVDHAGYFPRSTPDG